MPTARNARGVDIVAYNADASIFKGIQVKSLSKRDPVPLGPSLENCMGDFWIIVNKIASGAPGVFILTPAEVRRLAHRGEKDGRISYWLQPTAYEQPQFDKKWDRLRSGGTDVPVKPEEIVKFLKEHVENKANRYINAGGMKEYPAWTTAVKETLGELVQKYGAPHARSIFSGSGWTVMQPANEIRPPESPVHTTREFLLDFVWWQGEETGVGGRAIMGAECEWASLPKDKELRANEVLYDFEKLLSFKAPLKLLIFECRDSEGREHLHKRLCVYLEAFRQHVKGECYLFVEFSSWQCYAHIYEVKQDGTAVNVKLELLLLKADSSRAGA